MEKSFESELNKIRDLAIEEAKSMNLKDFESSKGKIKAFKEFLDKIFDIPEEAKKQVEDDINSLLVDMEKAIKEKSKKSSKETVSETVEKSSSAEIEKTVDEDGDTSFKVKVNVKSIDDVLSAIDTLIDEIAKEYDCDCDDCECTCCKGCSKQDVYENIGFNASELHNPTVEISTTVFECSVNALETIYDTIKDKANIEKVDSFIFDMVNDTDDFNDLNDSEKKQVKDIIAYHLTENNFKVLLMKNNRIYISWYY